MKLWCAHSGHLTALEIYTFLLLGSPTHTHFFFSSEYIPPPPIRCETSQIFIILVPNTCLINAWQS